MGGKGLRMQIVSCIPVIYVALVYKSKNLTTFYLVQRCFNNIVEQ